MKFDDLDRCPFCGFGIFHEKQKAQGTVIYRMYFDVNERYEVDNTEMYNDIDVITSGRAYCDSCERYLGNYVTGVIGKEAEKEYQKRIIKNESS